MEYHRIKESQTDALWELQILYKSEIGEDMPDEFSRGRLAEAI